MKDHIHRFIHGHRDCTVRDIERGVRPLDPAATWSYLIRLERDGRISATQQPDGVWLFASLQEPPPRDG